MKMVCSLGAGKGEAELITRDQCTLYFSWQTTYACRTCNFEDYTPKVSACTNGKQTTTYVKTEKCIGTPPEEQVSTCEEVEVNYKLGLGLGIAVTVVLILLAITLFYCWRKKKHYEVAYENLSLKETEDDMQL